jgi:hypothetical protein
LFCIFQLDVLLRGAGRYEWIGEETGGQLIDFYFLHPVVYNVIKVFVTVNLSPVDAGMFFPLVVKPLGRETDH